MEPDLPEPLDAPRRPPGAPALSADRADDDAAGLKDVSLFLQPLTAALLEAVTPADVVKAVVEQGIAVLGASAGLVALVTRDGSELEIVSTSGYTRDATNKWARFPANGPFPLSDVVQSSQSLYLGDRSDRDAPYPVLSSEIEDAFQASVSLPLAARQRVFGAIHFSFAKARTFDNTDRRFLDLLARQCALALERALLLEEVQREHGEAEAARATAETARGRLEFLARASALLGESLDYQSRLESLARLCVPEVADWAGVDILSEEGEIVRLAVAHRHRDREAAMRELQTRYPPDPERGSNPFTVIRTGARLFYPDISDSLIDQGAVDAEHARLLKRIGVSAALSVPITAWNKTLGALSLGMGPRPDGSGRSFTPEVIEMVEELARRAGTAVDNARLYAQARREISERKDTELALQASEGRYRRLLDTALEGILFVDNEKCITGVNDQLVRMLGYASQEEIVGQNIYFLFFPEDMQDANERWAARRAGVEGSYELRMKGKGDAVCWFIAHVTVERDADGEAQGTFTLFTDITERRAAQQALQAKTDEVVLTLESMTDGFYALNSDWRFSYINSEAERIVNVRREEIVGQLFWDAFPGSEHSAFGRAHRKAMRTRAPVTFEDYYPPLDVWLEVWAYPSNTGGLAVYFRNITERKQADQERENEREAALSRQREFMRDIIWSLTESRFLLCLSAADLPPACAAASDVVELTAPNTMRRLRRQLNAVTKPLGFSKERAQDIETGVGEAAMNCVTHGGGGKGWICSDPKSATVQIWIKDGGKGISEEALPKVLEKGVSTAGTLGHGFWLMLRTCDRVYLLTGPQGTTIVLQQQAEAPEPAWLEATS